MQWRARKLPFQPAHEFIAPDTRKARRFRSVSGCEKESDGSAVRKMRRCLAIETSEDHITAFIEPMQCKPVTAPQTDDKWMRSNWEVTLFSRHEKVLNKRFPRIVDALGSLEGDFVLNGELVALDSQGRSSFQILQDILSQALPTYCYAFDLLHRNGELFVNLPPAGATGAR
jgi:ATP-dependent DNA ligase